MKALVATGKPVVLVNMTGSAVAMPWEAEHVGAIVQAWYPGEMGGQAVAEVLFGAHNPAGRLPVTFYKATAELPAFTDYGMAAGTREAGGASPGRTYRYFTGVPQWAFGHGLSYTTFRYGGMAVDRQEAGAADTLKVSVDVLNTGTRDGDDVVQVYAAPLERQSGDALRRLVGFARVHLAAGKGTRVEVTVPVGLLRVWEEAGGGRYVVRPGKYVVQVGRSSMDIRGAREVVVK
jgi:beta-glucosidase